MQSMKPPTLSTYTNFYCIVSRSLSACLISSVKELIELSCIYLGTSFTELKSAKTVSEGSSLLSPNNRMYLRFSFQVDSQSLTRSFSYLLFHSLTTNQPPQPAVGGATITTSPSLSSVFSPSYHHIILQPGNPLLWKLNSSELGLGAPGS